MNWKEKIKALSETIESQKQTIDALLKKHAAMQESREKLIEALEEMVMIAKISGIEKKAWAEIQVARKAIAKAKGQNQ